MANTTNFGWETPDDTDLVKDGAAAMRTLGNSIDSSFVDLKGGTTGQILSKNSNTDLDYIWINNDQGDITAVTAGTGISGGGTSGAVTITNSMATEITASGDIIVGTGSGTFDNLPIGTTGQVLTADTTVSPYKVKWASPSASGFVGCSLYRTGTSQSYASNTNVIVTFNNEDFDTDGFHSNTTNTSRITIPTGKGGKYRFYYRGFVTSYSSSNYINVAYWVNGVDTLFIVNYPNTSWSEGYHQGEFIANLNAGDYVEVAVNQASGSTKDMRTDSYYYQRFYCQFLGA